MSARRTVGDLSGGIEQEAANGGVRMSAARAGVAGTLGGRNAFARRFGAWVRNAASRLNFHRRPPFKRRPIFEALEPRLLLSADLSPLATAGSTLHADPQAGQVADPGAPSYTLSFGARQDPHLVFDTGAPAGESQFFVLDVDGASGVRYEGPIALENLEIAPLRAPAHLVGQEQAVIDALLATLEREFAGTGVRFATEPPDEGEFSTIHVGGDGAAFSQWGRFFGLAEKTDTGNQDHADRALVFSENISGGGLTA